MLPLNWMLTHMYGIKGPAISNLIGFAIYNLIRYLFLYRKFKMQPFTWKSLYTVLLAAGGYFICYFFFDDKRGIEWIVIRSFLFCLLFAAGMISLKLTPDLKPVLATIRKRSGLAR
jgi:O-antigen/teichoic acid export membrane protein